MSYKRTSPIPIVEGGTNATTMATTDGVVYYDGTSLVTTGVGTATQVLTSNGVGMAPTFQPSGGGSSTLVLIETQNLLAASEAVFNTGITSAYNNYIFKIRNFSPDGTGGDLQMEISTDGGSTYINTGYAYQVTHNVFSTGTWAANFSSSDTLFKLLVNMETVGNLGMPIQYDLSLATVTSGGISDLFSMLGQGMYADAGSSFSQVISTFFQLNTSLAINAFRFTISTAIPNTMTGTISLYGLIE